MWHRNQLVDLAVILPFILNYLIPPHQLHRLRLLRITRVLRVRRQTPAHRQLSI